MSAHGRGTDILSSVSVAQAAKAPTDRWMEHYTFSVKKTAIWKEGMVHNETCRHLLEAVMLKEEDTTPLQSVR